MTTAIKGKLRAITESPSTSDETDELESDDYDDYATSMPPICKRTISAVSTKSIANPEQGIKALKLEDGSRHVRVYETIDLACEAVSYCFYPPVR